MVHVVKRSIVWLVHYTQSAFRGGDTIGISSSVCLACKNQILPKERVKPGLLSHTCERKVQVPGYLRQITDFQFQVSHGGLVIYI